MDFETKTKRLPISMVKTNVNTEVNGLIIMIASLWKKNKEEVTKSDIDMVLTKFDEHNPDKTHTKSDREFLEKMFLA